jgi:hypothetical protein
VIFLNQCSGIEAPRVWLGETIRRGGRGSVSHGTDIIVGMTEGGLVVIASANARKRRANHQSGYWPHLQACILP